MTSETLSANGKFLHRIEPEGIVARYAEQPTTHSSLDDYRAYCQELANEHRQPVAFANPRSHAKTEYHIFSPGNDSHATIRTNNSETALALYDASLKGYPSDNLSGRIIYSDGSSPKVIAEGRVYVEATFSTSASDITKALTRFQEAHHNLPVIAEIRTSSSPTMVVFDKGEITHHEPLTPGEIPNHIAIIRNSVDRPVTAFIAAGKFHSKRPDGPGQFANAASASERGAPRRG